MDAISFIPQPKYQKRDEDRNNDVVSSSISSLPDTVIQHVLSFLSIKAAVRTCILSKRWQYLWTSIPNLNFEEGTDRKLFMDFVERVLVHRGSSNIEKFSLSCDVACDASRINAWISAVIMRKVQKLNLKFDDVKKPSVLPQCFFTCDTLTMLELNMFWVLKRPTSICLPGLRTLILGHVIFSDDYAAQQLFSGCPALEKLVIEQYNWKNLTAVSISAPKLWSLEICSSVNDKNALGSCQVNIFGTSLRFFSYTGELKDDYCLFNLQSVVDACIDLTGSIGREREVAYRLNKLLRGLSGSKSLQLTSDAVEVFSYAEELCPHLPLFNNLKCLVFDTRRVYFGCGLLSMLQNVPHLESLVFSEGVIFWYGNHDKDRISNLVPSCLSSHLKTIELGDFLGDGDELFVVKFLLKNAVVLDKMVICCDNDLKECLVKKKIFHDALLMFPRGSPCCRIVFS